MKNCGINWVVFVFGCRWIVFIVGYEPEAPLAQLDSIPSINKVNWFHFTIFASFALLKRKEEWVCWKEERRVDLLKRELGWKLITRNRGFWMEWNGIQWSGQLSLSFHQINLLSSINQRKNFNLIHEMKLSELNCIITVNMFD